MSRFVRNIDFSSLGVKDLLEARELYHVHLANLENVVGTAIGRYRIRYTDPSYLSPDASKDPDDKTPRRLDNSGIRPWSWPCVLVFVMDWETKEELSGKPAQFIPPRLYLPDGRVVPTCVIHAPRRLEAPAGIIKLNFPSGLIGGGYPIFTDDQGQQRVGSIGCLVSDGYYTYAITSQHVIGEPGTVGYTFAAGKRNPIASAHTKAEGKVSLDHAYPGYPGTRTMVNIDAGLFRVDDVASWTSQVYGIGEIGDLIDLNVDTLNLDVVGAPVKAFGGASGPLRGEIQALFYRYRSVGGFDYVSDLLIGPRKDDGTVTTRPGDSGTLWFWDAEADTLPADTPPPVVAPLIPVKRKAPVVRPIAMQWGGHSFLEPGGQGSMQFALASSLGNVCRLLDVELIRDFGLGHSQYWGKVGHYKIGFSACSLASNAKLARLLTANATNISVGDDDVTAGNMPMNNSASFVALADVPDLVWRTRRRMDEANHFADMDEPGGPTGSGPTLMELWATPSNRTPQKWTAFYDNLADPPQDKHRGALPFRVRQLYESMVGFAAAGDVARFICAGGVLAHYVGDACQALHVSRFHHGHPGVAGESAVHAFYETGMLDAKAPDVIAGVNFRLNGVTVANHITGGAAAANRVVQLMQSTIALIDPETLVNTWVETAGPHHTQGLWDAVGEPTMECMANGALCLAELWESAWIEGGGGAGLPDSALDIAVQQSVLMGLYSDRTFVESKWLKDMSFA